MKAILALDQGTTSSRAALFDAGGRLLSVAQQEHAQHFPQPGWVEHDAEEIWAAQSRIATEALASAGLSTRDVAAIGITNQRETTLLWDRATGIPLSRAIVWQDRRTTPLCERLKQEGKAALFTERTGLLLDPYFSGTKLAWLLDHIDGARARAERGELAAGTIDTWLAWNLSSGSLHITDASNASRTLLFNIHTGQWDDELLGLLRIPRALLPEVRSSSEIYGIASHPAFEGIPISGMAGDQSAALFGQGCFSPGMAKNTYGTGCFLLMHTGEKAIHSRHQLLTTIAWQIDGKIEYALEGSIFMGGAIIQWLRDGLKILARSSDSETLATSVPDNGGVYFVPAFTGLGAPYWDPYARGTLVGLTRGSTDAHITRAALEAIAFQCHDVLEAMQADSGIPLQTLRVDGGAATNNFLLQFQADLLQTAIERPQNLETTAFGAAALAGLAVGFWKDRDALSKLNTLRALDRTFTPEQPPEAMAPLKSQWSRAVDRSRHWAEALPEAPAEQKATEA